LRWDDVRDERFLVTACGSGPEIHEYVVRRIAALGRQPRVFRHPVGREALLNLVGLGLGIAVVAETWCGTNYPDVVFRPIGDETDVFPFNAVWLHDNDNPALRRLLSLARSSAAAH
jgi:DNA-binding transcriptional LysR family regulator